MASNTTTSALEGEIKILFFFTIFQHEHKEQSRSWNNHNLYWIVGVQEKNDTA